MLRRGRVRGRSGCRGNREDWGLCRMIDVRVVSLIAACCVIVYTCMLNP